LAINVTLSTSVNSADVKIIIKFLFTVILVPQLQAEMFVPKTKIYRLLDSSSYNVQSWYFSDMTVNIHNVNKRFVARIVNSTLCIFNEYVGMIKLLLQINILRVYSEEERIIEER
jgi:hypothetical protein